MTEITLPTSSALGESEEATEQSKVPWFLRFLLIVSLLILVLFTGSEAWRWYTAIPPAPSVPGPSDQEIVPSVRIGFVTLGLAIGEVESRLGNAHVAPTEEITVYRFDSAGFRCTVEKRRVTSVLTLNPNFHTGSGIHVDSPVDDVIHAYGDGYEYDTKDSSPTATPKPGKSEPYVLHYWQKGVHFGIVDKTVHSIWVTEVVNS